MEASDMDHRLSGSDRDRVRRPWGSSLPSSSTVGLLLNVALRLAILGFAVEALLAADDPRFFGKGIAVRDLILAGAALTLLMPAIHVARGRLRAYPIWADSLILSILALDMAGNSLNLYEQAWRFDLVAHAYGPAAGFVALVLLGLSWLPALLAVNGAHLLLEAQEVLGDAIFGTHNVHGWWDTLTDLATGLAASVAVGIVWRRAAAQRRTPPVPSTAARATGGPTALAAGGRAASAPVDHRRAPPAAHGPRSRAPG
jgi:hypothetical protein